jgi:hypothetical protein
LRMFFHCSLLNGCATFRNRASANAVQESFFTLRYEKRGMEATLFQVVDHFAWQHPSMRPDKSIGTHSKGEQAMFVLSKRVRSTSRVSDRRRTSASKDRYL